MLHQDENKTKKKNTTAALCCFCEHAVLLRRSFGEGRGVKNDDRLSLGIIIIHES